MSLSSFYLIEKTLFSLVQLRPIQWRNYVRRGEAAASGRQAAEGAKRHGAPLNSIKTISVLCCSVSIKGIPKDLGHFSQILLR